MRVWGRPGEAGKKGQDSGTSPYEEFILECGGLDVLEDLQDVDNDRIYKLVMELLGGRSKP
jgi:importin subunit alpha-6/7